MGKLAKPLTWLLGIVFTVIGIAGFFVQGTLLGFEVGTVHNIVHLLTGVVAFYAASKDVARVFLVLFGLAYGAIAVLGFMSGNIFGLFPVNKPDNILHAVISGLGLVVGIAGGGEKADECCAKEKSKEVPQEEASPEEMKEDTQEESSEEAPTSKGPTEEESAPEEPQSEESAPDESTTEEGEDKQT